MPREFRLVTPVPVDLTAILLAAAAVDDSLAVRTTARTRIVQLVDIADETVVSLGESVPIERGVDVGRVAPALAGAEGYWAEAFAPWTTAGETGARIVVELVRRLGGRLERSDA